MTSANASRSTHQAISPKNLPNSACSWQLDGRMVTAQHYQQLPRPPSWVLSASGKHEINRGPVNCVWMIQRCTRGILERLYTSRFITSTPLVALLSADA